MPSPLPRTLLSFPPPSICPVRTFCVNGTTRHEAPGVRILSPVRAFSGFSHVVSGIHTSYHPGIVPCMDTSLDCLAEDTDRFVLKPSQRSFPALGWAQKGGYSERAGGTAVSFRPRGAPWPAFGHREWDPKAEALQGSRPHTSADHPLSHTSPPRTLTGAAEWEVLSSRLANLENLFAWQRPCGLGWGIKVISKSFHR